MTSDPFQRAGNLLVSALLSLAVLEHWFLMYPFGESALWRWALAPAKTPAPPPAKGGEPRDGATASIHPLPLQKRAQGH